ncbi:hypothetical protein TWF730_007127 [Orbilia blumenaviensis]|uniref:Uncharacterized protein n=1 Tax=Orbilia blumenaviensis TaxID=1796055 RepID=A0AAV9VJP9_9PEZI
MFSRIDTAQTLGFLQLFASLASAKFVIGVYDKAKELEQPVGRISPNWILCHPKKGARWGLYAADIAAGCNYADDGDVADQWTFNIPGDRHLDPGEEISRFYLTGVNAEPVVDKATGMKKGKPVITYDSNIQNTFFSYGYREGTFVDAPFTLVRNGKNLALSDSVAAKNADLLDFVGIGGTKDDQRVLRLQNFGGVGSYWHIGRGSALPVTKTTPVVEFRIIADPKKNKPSMFNFEEQKNDKEGTNLDYIDSNEYKVYEEMFPEQSRFGTFSTIGKGLFGGLAKSIGKAGGKVAGGIKNYMTKPKDVEEQIIEEEVIGGGPSEPTFERFEVETIKKDKPGSN